MKNTVLTLLAFAMLSAAHADQPLPADNILEAQSKKIQAQRKELFDPADPAVSGQKADFPSAAATDAEMKRIQPTRATMFQTADPHAEQGNFPNVSTPAVSHIDISSIAQRYQEKVQAHKMDNLMVFVSFSMPTESLKRVVREAARIGGTVVFRGLKDNSMQATTAAIRDLGEKYAGVVVNPNAFDKYHINTVPVLLLTKAELLGELDGQGCALPDAYVAVPGDVSLRYGLEAIARQDSGFTALANRYAQQLGGGQ